MLKFPYGIGDFEKIVSEEYFYIDHTDRIALLEQTGAPLLFLRPRRFGKSLWLSVLSNYYDVAKADRFEELFGRLRIGQQPTPRHNQYLILSWNFSMVATYGDLAEIRQALHNHLNNGIDTFAKKYHALLSYPIQINPTDAISSYESLLAALQGTSYKIYLLIDEYDNFANEVLMAGQSGSESRYATLIEGDGMLKSLFKVIKAGTEGRGIDRVFITGVSPLVMSDMTSGFNISKNISLFPEFNDLCGFQENDLRDVLHTLLSSGTESAEAVTEALNMMRTFYNGYRFAYDADAAVYNSSLAVYFLEHLAQRGQYPREMLDENLAMDRAKLAYIAQLPAGDTVILDALSPAPSLVAPSLAGRFGARDLLYMGKDRQFMLSLLYYFGVLTLMPGRTEFGELLFTIPNLTTRELYAERLRETILPDVPEREAAQHAARALYQRGDIQPLCEFIEQTYFTVFNNRDYRWANELTVKTAFLTLLFNTTFYIMDSETALGRQYADLTMIVRPDMRKYQLFDVLLEFKYVSLAEAGLSGEQVRAASRDELRALTPVQAKIVEASVKLNQYRQTLRDVYGPILRLHAFSVVAVGYDRLVWEAVPEE